MQATLLQLSFPVKSIAEVLWHTVQGLACLAKVVAQSQEAASVRPSLMAASLLAADRQAHGDLPPWPSCLQRLTGYAPGHLQDLVNAHLPVLRCVGDLGWPCELNPWIFHLADEFVLLNTAIEVALVIGARLLALCKPKSCSDARPSCLKMTLQLHPMVLDMRKSQNFVDCDSQR